MLCQPQPEPEEEPPRRDTAQRVWMIERWLRHAEEELLYAPDAAEEAPHRSATPGTLCAGAEASSGSWPSCASLWTPGTRWRSSRMGCMPWGTCFLSRIRASCMTGV